MGVGEQRMERERTAGRARAARCSQGRSLSATDRRPVSLPVRLSASKRLSNLSARGRGRMSSSTWPAAVGQVSPGGRLSILATFELGCSLLHSNNHVLPPPSVFQARNLGSCSLLRLTVSASGQRRSHAVCLYLHSVVLRPALGLLRLPPRQQRVQVGRRQRCLHVWHLSTRKLQGRSSISPALLRLVANLWVYSLSQETLSLVSAAFPKANLAARDPATIIFAVPSGNGFSRVDDRFWDQVVIQGKPDRMQVTVRLSFRERIIGSSFLPVRALTGSLTSSRSKDVLKVLSLVFGPVLAFFFVIAVCVLLFGK